MGKEHQTGSLQLAPQALEKQKIEAQKRLAPAKREKKERNRKNKEIRLKSHDLVGLHHGEVYKHFISKC